MTDRTVIHSAEGEALVDLNTGQPSVAQAWSAVMGDVTALGKNQRNTQQNFRFRGIDDVMNLVGPVLRQHGVSIIPSVNELRSRDFTTKSGTLMHEVHVTVTYTIIGPAGDEISGSAAGESADAGDKATPKAMSVAYRTFLLQALCLPTDEPDPDAQTTERSPAQTEGAVAQETADKLPQASSLMIVQGVEKWCRERNLLGQQVTFKGDSMPLERAFQLTYERLNTPSDADRAAEQRIKDGLGATEVNPDSVGAGYPEEEQRDTKGEGA